MASPRKRILTVMLIDDSSSEHVIFREILKAIDQSIHYVAIKGGREAILYFQQGIHKPDFIFIDKNMPAMDGVDTLRELKEINFAQSIPMIMYSSELPESFRETAMLIGASDCIQKNFDLDESIGQISAFLNPADNA
jgi:CheY-like chemotaxis protein